MVSTSGSGMSTLKYGTMRENVLSLTVVTPDGGIIERTRQPVRKSSAGLELTQLFIGSEGTLGVVCAVCVRLFPLETYSAGALASFDTLQDAVRSVVALRSAGVPSTLLRCELLSKDAVVGTNALCVKENKSDAQIPVCPTLLLEFVATNMRDIHRDFKVVAGIIKKVGNLKKHAAIRFAKKGPKMDALWSARRRCGIAAMKYVGTATCITTDVCVPLTALANCIVDTEKEFANYLNKEDGTTQSIPCIICAHISDGNFHVVIPYKNEKEMRVAKDLETSLVRRAIACGGTISGEHGVGIGKVRHVVEEHGDVHVDVQESIKKSLDPCNGMNPAGKVYPSQLTLFPAAHL
ncbi:D-lactate dehydrogenase (cytochrome) [Angomonas deanei]|nr:D-lactate dehydrogenase (cytochrome) [Angomonas deanei]|eukprot:EPY29778.1 D-lactate dehydrogenase (cytochrome) [Angomonas deanei]